VANPETAISAIRVHTQKSMWRFRGAAKSIRQCLAARDDAEDFRR